jgi:hypothetical protein
LPLGRSRPGARAAWALAAGLICSCNSWRTPHLSPGEVIRQRQPTSIQVRRTDSSQIELRSPRLVGDSLVGLRVEPGTSDSRPLAIPLSQVSQVAIRQPDPIRTAVVIGATLLALGGLLFAVAFGQGLSMWYDELAETED